MVTPPSRWFIFLFHKPRSIAAPCRYSRRAHLSSSPLPLASSDKPRVKPQLTLASFGFTEDDEEFEAPWYVTGRRQTSAREKKKAEQRREEKNEELHVRHTPEKVKKAALDASKILAKIRSLKTTRVPSKKKTKQAASDENETVISQLNAGPAKASKTPKVPARSLPGVKIPEAVAPMLKTPANATTSKMPALAELDRECSQEISVKRVEDEPHLEHPWPEWVDFLEFLLKNKFFDGTEEWVEKGKCLFATNKCVRHATVAFSRGRGDIFRFFSQEDLKVLASYGCPDMEKKASNACKRLRLSLKIPEGQVCLKCRLKMACPRAFLDPRMMTSPCPRTLDVVRIITNFALNASPTAESPLSYPAEVCDTVCRLFREIVTHGASPRDPFFENKFHLLQASQPKKMKHQTQDDWLCPNCEFLNFAKNAKCRECGVLCPEPLENDVPEDWQCPKCKYLNYDRNSICRRCKAEREIGGSDKLLGYRPWKQDGNFGNFEGRRVENMRIKPQGIFSLGKENYEKWRLRNMSKETLDQSRGTDKVVDTFWSRGVENRSDTEAARRRPARGGNVDVLKLRVSKRTAAAESDYEASEDDRSDSDDHLEAMFSDSDFDLSAEENEALSSAPVRIKAPKALYAWVGGKKSKTCSFYSSSQKSRKTLK